ncbi:uncharacterized protein LOC120326014 [Styela clava]
MAGGPSMVEIPAFPLPQPTEIVCPAEYMKHKTACFKFGSHSSYETAKTACENVGARLADIEPVFSKYVRDKVRTMGGNDFWIGSFINRGRTYKQKGRTSCPIMRGQMINDALYGLVDCNSANRYICQKYGPVPQTNLLGMGPLGPGGQRPGLPTTAKPTTTTEEIADASGGGLSPVIYVVITAVILIIGMIVLKLLIGRYFRDKKKAKAESKKGISKKKVPEQNTNGKIFYPKWRTKSISKTTSVDSAVPPSNPSPLSEKKYSQTPKQRHKPPHGEAENEMDRIGRPRVNGPPPTRKPPHMNGDILDGYHGRTIDKSIYDRDRRHKKRRRTHSDPRSDYGASQYGRRHSKRRYSHYSEYSQSTSDSYSDDSTYSGPIYGPTKVYQRHPSRNQGAREPMHYHIDPAYYRGFSKRHSHDYHQRRHRSRHKSYGHSNHGNLYHFDGHRSHSRHISHKESRYGNYGKGHHIYNDKGRSQIPSVSANVYDKQQPERQYFPQPHRLMSWTSPAELKELNNQSDEALVQDTLRSFPKEPIRVSRQIHQNQKNTKTGSKSKKPRKSKSKHDDDDHFYEILDEKKRNKQAKKSSHRNKNRKKSEERNFARASQSRLSMRSVASIQSRRLPTPPI